MGKYIDRKAVIVGNCSGHEFADQTEVVLLRIYGEGGESEHWYAEDGRGDGWFVCAEDFELIEEDK